MGQNWSAAMPVSLDDEEQSPIGCPPPSTEMMAGANETWTAVPGPSSKHTGPRSDSIPPSILPSMNDLGEEREGIATNEFATSLSGNVEVDARRKWQLRLEKRKARSSGRKSPTY